MRSVAETGNWRGLVTVAIDALHFGLTLNEREHLLTSNTIHI